MAKNKLADLKDHLFETLEALKDPDNPMEIARALAVRDVAQTLINVAKTEVEMAKIIGANVKGGFFEVEGEDESRELPRRLTGAGPQPMQRRVAGGSGGSEA